MLTEQVARDVLAAVSWANDWPEGADRAMLHQCARHHCREVDEAAREAAAYAELPVLGNGGDEGSVGRQRRFARLRDESVGAFDALVDAANEDAHVGSRPRSNDVVAVVLRQRLTVSAPFGDIGCTFTPRMERQLS